jgi:hypothetical protein
MKRLVEQESDDENGDRKDAARRKMRAMEATE